MIRRVRAAWLRRREEKRRRRALLWCIGELAAMDEELRG